MRETYKCRIQSANKLGIYFVGGEMIRSTLIFSLGLLLCVLNSAPAAAQATAQISGAVRDSSNAVLPGAQVTATQTGTGVSRMTITNEGRSITDVARDLLVHAKWL